MPFESRNDGLLRKAVRGLAAALLVALCASGPSLYFAAPHEHTQASIAAPWFERRFFLDPRWKDWRDHFELYLRETSPVTVLLRGMYAERLFELGWLDSEQVHFGTDGWLFIKYGLVPPKDLEIWSDTAPRRLPQKRKAFLRGLKASLDEVGIALLVVVVPDKDRIYPEKCWPSGRLPPDKTQQYEKILSEIAECGLHSFDGARVMLDYKRAHPEDLLFHPRNTHWTQAGARAIAAAAVAEVARLGWIEMLGPEMHLPQEPFDYPDFPDLVGMLGIREGSSLADRLAGRHVGVVPRLPPGFDIAKLESLDASVALCGTSFSANGLLITLPLELDRYVDPRGVKGAVGPFPGLLLELDVIRKGERHPKLIVWEYPERSIVEWGWLDPPEVPKLR